MYVDEIKGRRHKENELEERLKILHKENEKLSKLISVDYALGIATRRYFDEQLFLEWRRSMRFARPLSMIIMDIDHMGAYSRLYGAEAGDECIKKIAKALGFARSRTTDVIARHEDDDFLVLLPETNLVGALTVAKAIKRSVNELKIEFEKSPIAEIVTISIGVATVFPDLAKQPLVLFENAKKNLKEAKKGGRNQIKSSEIK